MGLSEIRERLDDLRRAHRDLDSAIAEVDGRPAANQLELRRLKKRKLRLREQIAYLESRLIPDLDA